ncbi:tetratricopeptide repeat protein [Planctomycetota bacterium]
MLEGTAIDAALEESRGETGPFRAWFVGEEIEGLYRIEAIIGQGNMGIVYKATDLATNMPVVIKSLLEPFADNKILKQRFLREAEEWIGLGVHPNIIRAYTVHEIGWLPRVVAEYADGGTLYDLFGREKISLEKVLNLAVQICWGMAYSHDRNLIHRDLKPQNILLTSDGVLKIADFGLVKRQSVVEEAGAPGEPQLESAGTLMTIGLTGTPEYMAPEQWSGQGQKAGDIYAFGVMLYEFCCGRRPFSFPDLPGPDRLGAYRKAHCEQIPANPGILNAELPAELCNIIMQCLAKDPAKRPQDFRPLGQRLNKIAFELFAAPAGEEPPPEELDRRGKLDQANGYLKLAEGCHFRGDFDRALTFLEQAYGIFEPMRNREGIANYFKIRGGVLSSRSDYDNALKMFHESLTIADETGNSALKCRCYLGLGVVYQYLGDYGKLLEMVDKSMQIAGKTEDRILMSACYMEYGRILMLRRDYDRSDEMIQKSLALSEAMGDLAKMAKAYSNLGVNAQLRKQFNKALEMHQKGLEIYQILGEKQAISISYSNLSGIYHSLGQFDKGLEMNNRSMEIKESLKDKKGMSGCYSNMAACYWGMGQLDQALALYRKSLALKKTVKDPAGQRFCYHNIGRLCFDKKDYDKAIKMLKKSVLLAERLQSRREGALSLYYLGRAYRAKNLNPEALEVFRKSLLLFEEVEDAENCKRIRQLIEEVAG